MSQAGPGIFERIRDLLEEDRMVLDEYDPDDASKYLNEVMAEDDAKDPYLESYQHFGKIG